jgi:tetratricopeptide (TPR) repeat protein
LWLAGRAAEAESIQLRAIAMDPPGGAFEFRHLCIVRLLLGRYDEAVEACEKAGGLDNWYEDQLWLIAAYAQRGDLAKAARAMSVLRQQQPGLTIENSLIRAMSDNPTYVRQLETHVYPGLRKAGIPER